MQKPTKFALVVNLKAAKALMPKTLSVGEGAISYIKANDGALLPSRNASLLARAKAEPE